MFFRVASGCAPGDTAADVSNCNSSGPDSSPCRIAIVGAALLSGLAACATGSSDATGTDAGKPDQVGPDAAIGGRADAAQGLQADAGPPGTPDATPVINPADASVPLPDADPNCIPAPLNLLANSDFDLGPGSWTETSGGGFALITSQDDVNGVDADSGTFVAWLGGYTPATGTANDIFFQDFSVPGDATAIALTGKIWVDSAEIPLLPFDTLDLEVVNVGTGAVLESLASWSNLDSATGWFAFNANLTGSYQGQTIRLRWTADFDSTQRTSFFLDTLALDTTSCP